MIDCPNCGKQMTPKHYASSHTEPHGEHVWQEWDECPLCGEILEDE